MQGDSGGVGLRQVVHQRRPAAARGREGEGLRAVVVHHLQAPVGVERHGVTCTVEWGGDA